MHNSSYFHRLDLFTSQITLNSNLKLKNKCKYYLKYNFIALQDNYFDMEEHVHETHKYATHRID